LKPSKDTSDVHTLEHSNTSANLSIHDVRAQRRTLFKAAAAALALPALNACAFAAQQASRPKVGFKPIAAAFDDALRVPEGYSAQVIAPWGEPIGLAGNMPAFKMDASNSAADQAAQMGMHHDALHFYPLNGSSANGLLAMNHEYVDDGLLHTDGLKTWSAEKVRKSQAAHGISVIEVKRNAGGAWGVERPSKFARRITANTPFAIGGPGRGHAMMQTAADPKAETILGTFNNCAAGMTPWGTYLSGEENFRGYFGGANANDAHAKRWGLGARAWSGWDRHDERFDLSKNPNEANRFGWIVEVDPYDPQSTPVKRTAMGRAAHEGAWVAVTKDKRAVVYSGEDAGFEYIYKFVSRDAIREAKAGQTRPQANRDLLDHGTLYVARFDADGSGVWLPMVHGQGPLTAANGFADQGEVVIKARQASDALGATKMDRPEWLAIDPHTGTVYCTLTNNSARGREGNPATDAANPRAGNTHGHIIRWQEQGDFSGTKMKWDHLVLAGDPANERAESQGNIKGDLFGSPDGIAFDPRGVLWVQTDASTTQMQSPGFKNIGNNQMLACDVATGEFKRFLTGPRNCEITGATWTPDGTTMFVNIQHPGETPGDRSDPEDTLKYSRWPDGDKATRPRSATVVIRKLDGGVVGT
jgi:uncharacterized protein